LLVACCLLVECFADSARRGRVLGVRRLALLSFGDGLLGPFQVLFKGEPKGCGSGFGAGKVPAFRFRDFHGVACGTLTELVGIELGLARLVKFVQALALASGVLGTSGQVGQKLSHNDFVWASATIETEGFEGGPVRAVFQQGEVESLGDDFEANPLGFGRRFLGDDAVDIVQFVVECTHGSVHIVLLVCNFAGLGHGVLLFEIPDRIDKALNFSKNQLYRIIQDVNCPRLLIFDMSHRRGKLRPALLGPALNLLCSVGERTTQPNIQRKEQSNKKNRLCKRTTLRNAGAVPTSPV
jgi:hypothetical protein